MKSLNLSAFWRGACSVFDLSGGQYEYLYKGRFDYKVDSDKANVEALAGDMKVVGDSLRWAIREYDNCK